MGLFYRTLRIVENGIKPVYVFDGKPPDLKAGIVSASSMGQLSLHLLYLTPFTQLSKRFERRQEAAEDNAEAKETGTVEEMDKFSRRTVRVTKEHNEECRKLLTLMGIPFVMVSSTPPARAETLLFYNPVLTYSLFALLSSDFLGTI
jgi:flap endonuclease-1